MNSPATPTPDTLTQEEIQKARLALRAHLAKREEAAYVRSLQMQSGAASYGYCHTPVGFY